MISIIVPVYNAEKYIENCVNSIIAQTFDNIEILLIDDGSRDDSGKLIDTLCLQDKRIKTFHKQNGGVSEARNLGLDNAAGEYIMFVDADDWLEAGLCKKLIEPMDKSDFAIGGFRQLFASKQKTFVGEETNISMHREFGKSFDELYKKNLLNPPFSKLYKKKLIANQRFDSSVALGEDFLFNLEYLKKCSLISIVHTDAYVYNCMNENSATRKFRDKDIFQIIELYRAGKNFRLKYDGKSDEVGILEERLCINGINLLQLLFYSNYSNDLKESLTLELFGAPEFISACKHDWKFPIKYDIPRKLCAKKSIIKLKYFYYGKKTIQQLQNKARRCRK